MKSSTGGGNSNENGKAVSCTKCCVDVAPYDPSAVTTDDGRYHGTCYQQLQLLAKRQQQPASPQTQLA